MIEILPSPDNVVAIRATGTLTSEDYDRMIAEIEAKLQRNEKLGIFADMVGFDDMTAKAISKDISYSFSKLGEWNRFNRNALVTDKQWMRVLASTVATFLPNLEIKVFDPAEREEALSWVSALASK